MGKRAKKQETPLRRPGGRPQRRMPPGWVGASDIAVAVGFGPRWVRRHMGSFAVRLNGRDYRWRVNEVNQWLGSNALPPLPDVGTET